MEEVLIPFDGLDRDVNELQRKEGSYTYMLNGVSSSGIGNKVIIQNETGNIFSYDLQDFQLIGKRYISEYDKHLLCLTNGEVSRIGLLSFQQIKEGEVEVLKYCTDCTHGYQVDKTKEVLVPKSSSTFELLVESRCLNFSIDHRVNIEYKLTNCSFNIYFSDNYNEDRYLYFDIIKDKFYLQNQFKIGYKKNCDGESYTNELNCNYAGWYQKFNPFTITTSFENGGSLTEGTYQVLAAWATSKGVPLNSYRALTNPLPLSDFTLKDPTQPLKTSKGLQITVTLDEEVIHSFYNLIIIQTINSSPYYVKVTLPKDQKEYFYTDTTTLTPVTENEIFNRYPYYEKSKYLTVANNHLIRAGLTEFQPFNLQRVANEIKLGWFTVEMQEGAYANSIIAQNYRTYLRGEQYAIGIVFDLDNGDETPVYHIPGRLANPSEKELITDPTNTDLNNPNKLIEKWRLYNTASITSSPKNKFINHKEGEEFKIYEEGEFAYWESSDFYPNNKEIWGDLCGQPIRLIKFPDNYISNHHNGRDLTIPTDYITPFEYPKTYIYPIGIKVNSNIGNLLEQAVSEGVLTQQQRNRIVGYRIVRADRSGNKSIQAKGYIYNTLEYEKNNSIYRFPNYPFNDLQIDDFIARNDERAIGDSNLRKNNIQKDNKPYYTFHSPDTSFVNPSLGNKLKIESETYGTAKTRVVEVEGEATHKILSQRHYNFAILIASIIARAYQPNQANLSGSSNSIGQSAGTLIGGVAGSIIPGVGTAIGATLGGLLGGLIGNAFEKDNDRLKAGPRAVMWLAQTEKMLQLLTLTTPEHQYQYQLETTGKYFGFKPRKNETNSFYKLESWKYLSPESTTIPVKTGSLLFNNWQRESSVFLELDRALPDPTVVDTTKVSRTFLFGQDHDKLRYNVSSQYVSIFNDIKNQYGTVFNFRYLSTDSKSYRLDQQATLFGGDTYIGNFSIKRKHRFFNSTTYGFAPNTDIYYEDLGNAGFPIFWFNTKNTDEVKINLLEGLTFLPGIDQAVNSLEKTMQSSRAFLSMSGTKNSVPKLGVIISFGIASLFNKKTNIGDELMSEFMEDIGDFFQAQLLSPDKYLKPPRYYFDGFPTDATNTLSTNPVKGRIYLYWYGIPTFICESDINLDLRHAENDREKAFYPFQSNLNEWLQHKNTPFFHDNFYGYDLTYSKQSKEHSYIINDINFRPYEECRVTYPNRVIHSLQDTDLEDNLLRDNWLVNRALDMYDFGYSQGLITSINQLENAKVLVRFENGWSMFSAFNQLRVDKDTVNIGNGGLFQSKPMTFSKSELGYHGSQHQAFLSTEYGHVSVDAKRGMIFILESNGERIEEITRNQMQKWFTQHLPFQINQYFDIDIDNEYKGVGLHMCYDSLLKRLLITKLDYKPKFKEIYYNGTFTYKGKTISLNDKRYFHNLSWTISYDFEFKRFRSWHSYTPNYYLTNINYFYSNYKNSLWVHNKSNQWYQNFYNTQYPFIIDGFTKPHIQKSILKAVSFGTQGIRYTKNLDQIATDTTFEEAVVYNQNQVSGRLVFRKIDYNNRYLRKSFPVKNADHTEILLDQSNDEFNFNQFDNKRINELPIWNHDKVNGNKELNSESLAYHKNELSCDIIKSQIHSIRLINLTNSSDLINVEYVKLKLNGGLR